MLKNGDTCLFGSEVVRLKWPNLMAEFLLERMEFPISRRYDCADEIANVVETTKLMYLAKEPPQKILGNLVK